MAMATHTSPMQERHGSSLLPQIAVGMTLGQVEREMILTRLRVFAGNKSRAADSLGISLKTLYNKLNAYRSAGLLPAEFE